MYAIGWGSPGVLRARTQTWETFTVLSVVAALPGRKRTKALAVAAALVTATLTIAIVPALAASPTVFRNIATTLPGNVPSEAFQATSTSEFGDLIQLGAGERSSANLPVTVVMSSWACQRGGDASCSTDPGATWDQPLTLTIYNVNNDAAVPAAGTVVLQTTQTFAIPYRPSYDPTGPCQAKSSTGWYSAAEDHGQIPCYNGLAHPVTFTLPAGITLPGELIWTISFNTETHGYAPLGKSGPWNSLNVGAQTFSGQPVVGTDVESMSAFLNSTWAGAYNDKGAAGTGIFRDDVGNATDNWSANAPLACFGACPINLAAAPTPTPTATPTTVPTNTPTGTPIESFAGVTSAPSEVVGGATATPQRPTPPPTSSDSPSQGGSSGMLVLLISLGFGAVGIFAVGAQHRTMRR
jgi:hypothetical protein